MRHEDVLKMMVEMGLPFAYDHFVEGESPEPPFLVFYIPKLTISQRTGLHISKSTSLTLNCTPI